jgi:cyclic beta-1,2-glucan synthetase
LLSIERLEERARALAATFTLSRDLRHGDRAFYRRLDDNTRVLRHTYRILADDVHRGEFLPPAAEWFLDNFYLIESEIRGVRHDLPRPYYRELPKLASREAAGGRARLRRGARTDPAHRRTAGPYPARALHERVPDGGAAHHR